MRLRLSFRLIGYAWAVTLTALLLAHPVIAAENYKGFERGGTLITPQELKELIEAKDPKLVVIAAIKGKMDASYLLGHIPGSYGVLRHEYEPKVGDPYNYVGMMTSRTVFQDLVRSLGIDEDSKVVIYDWKVDAARMWWAFYLYGKTDVRVLDGGYYAWKAAGYPTNLGRGPERPDDGTFVAAARRAGWVAGLDDVYRARNEPTIRLWDTRELDEWTGKKKKKYATRAGRIPWAEYLPWLEFRDEISGKPALFKPAAEIQQVIDKHGMKEGENQLLYCQSGVRTTNVILALYLMGWDPDLLHNYDGSWLEWSYFGQNPIVRGE